MTGIRSIEFTDALRCLQGLVGADLQIIINFHGTLCACYLVGRLTKIETLHPEEAAVNLVIDERNGVLLDPDDIVEILVGGDLDNDGSIEFYLPSEIAIRIERTAR